MYFYDACLVLLIWYSKQFVPDLHLNWERTKTIAAASSNTWGLFVLVILPTTGTEYDEKINLDNSLN